MVAKVQTLCLVKIGDIKPAPWNPERRVQKISGLIRSIEAHGLLQPILVDRDNNLCDGHRRMAACSYLGWEEIPAIRVQGDIATIYGEVTTHLRKPNGNELLLIYLANPQALSESGRLRTKYQSMEEELGRPMLQKLAKQGLSIATWKAARTVANYLDRHDQAFIRRAVKWMMQQGTAHSACRAVMMESPPKELLTAIVRNRELRVSYKSA